MRAYARSVYWCFAILLILGLGTLIAAEIIQTQENETLEGVEADITRLSIRNDIMTLRFKVRNSFNKTRTIEFYFKDFYIIDPANQKKYFALKDSDGQFIGGPKEKEWEGGRFRVSISTDSSAGFWVKFPVPADSTDTIDVSIPGFFPFEEISLQ
jgi:hypothetical protein